MLLKRRGATWAGPGAGPGRGRGRGRAERGRPCGRRRGGEAEAGAGASAAAGHDRVVPVLPAAAGRAPLPRPLRYRPRVPAGGCQARAHVGGAPRGASGLTTTCPGPGAGRRPPVPVRDPARPGPGRPPAHAGLPAPCACGLTASGHSYRGRGRRRGGSRAPGPPRCRGFGGPRGTALGRGRWQLGSRRGLNSRGWGWGVSRAPHVPAASRVTPRSPFPAAAPLSGRASGWEGPAAPQTQRPRKPPLWKPRLEMRRGGADAHARLVLEGGEGCHACTFSPSACTAWSLKFPRLLGDPLPLREAELPECSLATLEGGTDQELLS